MAHIFFLLFPFKPAQAGLSHPPAHLHPVGPPLPPKPGSLAAAQVLFSFLSHRRPDPTRHPLPLPFRSPISSIRPSITHSRRDWKSSGLPHPLRTLPATISAPAPPAPLHALPTPVPLSRCTHHLRWQGVPLRVPFMAAMTAPSPNLGPPLDYVLLEPSPHPFSLRSISLTAVPRQDINCAASSPVSRSARPSISTP
jgi:hypothetical protein